MVSRVSAFIAWFPESDEASGEAAATRTDSNLLAVRFADNRGSWRAMGKLTLD